MRNSPAESSYNTSFLEYDSDVQDQRPVILPRSSTSCVVPRMCKSVRYGIQADAEAGPVGRLVYLRRKQAQSSDPSQGGRCSLAIEAGHDRCCRYPPNPYLDRINVVAVWVTEPGQYLLHNATSLCPPRSAVIEPGRRSRVTIDLVRAGRHMPFFMSTMLGSTTLFCIPRAI